MMRFLTTSKKSEGEYSGFEPALASAIDSDSESNLNSSDVLITNKRKYAQAFLTKWQKDFEWVQNSSKGKAYAHCKVCFTDLFIGTMGKAALKKHQERRTHKSRCNTMWKQPTIEHTTAINKTAEITKIAQAEIKIALFVAEHNLAFNLMDHFVQVISEIAKDSEISKKIKCGRTKVSAIIKNVLGKYYIEHLSKLMNTQKFSLMVDEASDVCLKKHLCLIVRLRHKSKVLDFFYDLLEVDKADAISLYNLIINSFKNCNVDYKKNLIGFAADGASVMTGKHHSVASLLKKDIDNLFVIKCICHSFHLCASYACEQIPGEIECLTRNIYNYLKSSKRLSDFKSLQTFFEIKPLKILIHCQTRWLSLQSVIKRIISQYDVLKAYFNIEKKESKLIQAENIYKMLLDHTTKLYFLFLDFILPYFNNLNKLYQSESPQLCNLHKTMKDLVLTFLQFYMKKEYVRNHKIIEIQVDCKEEMLEHEAVYMGAKVEQYILQNQIGISELQDFRQNCLKFYIEGAKQILARFDFDSEFWSHLNLIDATEIYSGKHNSVIKLIYLLPHLIEGSDIQKIDTQYRLLQNFLLDNETISADRENAELFWNEVSEIKMGHDEPAFLDLTNFVLNIFKLPHSSASVERMFSQVNIQKTKLRNLLNSNTIKGCLYAKSLLKLNDCSCYNFEVNKELLKYFNQTMYDFKSD